MLCGLGAATFATAAIGRWYAAALALGFAATAAWTGPGRLPDPAWTGGAVALIAIAQLVRPRVQFLTVACGGSLAGVMASLLRTEGLTTVPAIIGAVMLPAIAACLAARRRDFLPAALQEEALLLVFALGLVVAVIPAISAGWSTALVLNREASSSMNQVISAWVLLLSGASAMLGGLYSVWRHR
jgi:hypothetical protein